MSGPVSNYPYGGMYGVGGSSGSSSSPFSAPFADLNSTDTLSLSGQGEEKKSHGIMGAITDFGKGIFKGAVNTVTSLFSLKGLAMTLGAAALVAVAAPVAIPLLIAGGLGIGGMQIFKGVTTGDWEKAGEGTFTVGATLLGAKVGPKSFKGADNVEYTMKGGETFMGKLTGYAKSMMPTKAGKVYEATKDGQPVLFEDKPVTESAFGVAKESFSGLGKKASDMFNGLRNRFRKSDGETGSPKPTDLEDGVSERGQVDLHDAPKSSSKDSVRKDDGVLEKQEIDGEAPKKGKGLLDRFKPDLSSPQTSGLIMSSSMAGAMSGDDGIPGLPGGIPGLSQQ